MWDFYLGRRILFLRLGEKTFFNRWRVFRFKHTQFSSDTIKRITGANKSNMVTTQNLLKSSSIPTFGQ